MLLIITLLVIGLLLLAIEVLITPGVGLAGILGLLAIIGASIFGFTMFGTITGIVILASIITIIAIFIWLILRSKTWKKVTLNESITARVDVAPEEKGITVGLQGVTISRLVPSGKARIDNYTVEVTSRDGVIQNDSKIEVISIEDGKIFVKQIDTEINK